MWTAHFCPFFRFRKAVSLLRFGARIAKEAEPAPGPECELLVVGEKNILFVEDVFPGRMRAARRMQKRLNRVKWY